MYLLEILRKFSFVAILAVFFSASANAEQRTIIVEIDGERWQLRRHAEHCNERVKAAIARYEEKPIYDVRRVAAEDRFLVNEMNECWVELNIQGVDDTSFIFKVSHDLVVSDQRQLSWSGYKVSPYPNEPYGY
ncbi:MAG: hypothetical protein ABJG15_03910 [Hyphomonadaceae bacterium]